MKTIDPAIMNFFGGLPEYAALNSLKPLRMMFRVEAHQERIKKILSLTNPGLSIASFVEILDTAIEELESRLGNEPELMLRKPLSGASLKHTKKHTPLWPMHALYWAYGLNEKSDEEILLSYLSAIGDIALKYIEYYHRMKEQEERTGEGAHPFSFWEFIASGKVRSVEFLTKASRQESDQLNDLYFDNDSFDDLDLLFYYNQDTYPWESEALSVIDTSERKVMKYDSGDITFQVLSSRVLKPGSLDSFESAHRNTLQLYNLEGAKHNSKYRKMGRSPSSGAKYSIKPIVEEMEEELLPLITPIPHTVLPEEKIEAKALARRQRRDSKEKQKQGENRFDDSPYAQHLRNKAASANIAKNGLPLTSSYEIPKTELLKMFISSLPVEDKSDRLLAALFVLNIVLGCEFYRLIEMLRSDKDGAIQHKDGTIITKLDSGLFASETMMAKAKSSKKITYSLPHLTNMLIAKTRSLLSDIDNEEYELEEEYKEYLKKAAGKFLYRISINIKKIHRYLGQYAFDQDEDVMTTSLATTSYSQADTAKLTYVSTRSESSNHSRLVERYWTDLGLDNFARSLVGLPDGLFSTQTRPIPKLEYAGSTRCPSAESSRDFFGVLEENLKERILDDDLDSAFNLASIGLRYASSLLLGTRGFRNSANFESSSSHLGVLVISEKATSIAAGVRLIPMCGIIQSLLENYNETFLKSYGLSKNIWLRNGEKNVLFSQKLAHTIIKTIPDLKNRDTLEQYVVNTPLNAGRHCLSRMAMELSVPTTYINAYLGHYFAGAEQFGIYSSLNISDYTSSIRRITSRIASEHGIKDRLW